MKNEKVQNRFENEKEQTLNEVIDTHIENK